MDKYEEIYNYLQESVDNGTMTVEQAEALNDLAYDKYVTEGNAYNRVADKQKKEYEQNKKIADKLDDIGTEPAKKLREKYSNKADEIECGYMRSTDHYLSEYNKKGQKNPCLARNDARNAKRNWMYTHGDRGQSPEEKYKKGRYQEIQKVLDETKGKKRPVKESADELKLLLFDACESGLIDELQRDYLLDTLYK